LDGYKAQGKAMVNTICKLDDIFDAVGEVYAYAKERDWTRSEFVKFLRDSQKGNIIFHTVEAARGQDQ